MLDLNLAVIAGRLSAPPDIRTFPSGSRLVRYLVTVRTEEPRRRVDVLPITLWDPAAELVDDPAEPGQRIRSTGSIQRRFWEGENGRRSRLEIVADQVTFGSDPEAAE